MPVTELTNDPVAQYIRCSVHPAAGASHRIKLVVQDMYWG